MTTHLIPHGRATVALALNLAALAGCAIDVEEGGDDGAWTDGMDGKADQAGERVLVATDTPVDIPDNNATGIESRIVVPSLGTASGVEVSVDIRHPYRGDLVVKLVCPDGTVATLHDRTGGSADDIRKSFTVSACAGRSVGGTFRLKVADRARHDRGRLERFTLKLSGLTGDGECRPTTDTIDDIYFEDIPSYSWMQCYTVSTEQAAALIREGRIAPTVLLGETAEVSGDVIRVRYRYPGVWPGDTVTFRPCPFDKTDSCVHDCTITFQDEDPAAHQSELAGLERACSSARPELRGRYVDCAARVAHPITNTWRQPVSRKEIKLMQHLLSQSRPLVAPGVATGQVDQENHSLEPCMDWSGQLGFTFAKVVVQNETCDASLARAPFDVGRGNVWCPWGIQIVKVSCDGGPEIVDTRNPWNLPLDQDNPDVRALCEGSGSPGPIGRAATDTPLAIPDNHPAGVTSRIDVPETGTARAVRVTVDIRHPYRGDLRVAVRCPDGTETVLSNRQGGSADDVRGTWDLPACAGRPVQGGYQLVASDHAAWDVGSIASWRVDIER